MRQDMRLGFGVGGVLLAVIIVAILVIHRNQGKTVASLDKSGASTTESTTIGPNDVQPGAPTTDDAANLKPADPLPPKAPEAKVPDPKIPGVADDSAKGNDTTQWDRLFASSSDTSPKSKLGNRKASSAAAPQGQPSDSSSQVADLAPTHDADNAMPAADKVAANSSKPKSTTTGDAPGAREHVVKSGESFYTIAKAAYGDSKHTKDLQAANPTIEASKLRPGMTLKIPALASLKSTSEAKATKPAHSAAGSSSTGISLSARTSNAPAADSKTYTVKSGDYLYKIARDLYGNGAKGDDIYALNKDVIGNDSTKLKIGQVLKLPSAPTAAASR